MNYKLASLVFIVFNAELSDALNCYKDFYSPGSNLTKNPVNSKYNSIACPPNTDGCFKWSCPGVGTQAFTVRDCHNQKSQFNCRTMRHMCANSAEGECQICEGNNCNGEPFGHVRLLKSNSTTKPEVSCFCNQENCRESTCVSQFCLVGMRMKDGAMQLEQGCTKTNNLPEKCTQNLDGWSEVCVCDSSNCNTFAYLRTRVDKKVDEGKMKLVESSKSNWILL